MQGIHWLNTYEEWKEWKGRQVTPMIIEVGLRPVKDKPKNKGLGS